jgi:hypothetical protein
LLQGFWPDMINKVSFVKCALLLTYEHGIYLDTLKETDSELYLLKLNEDIDYIKKTVCETNEPLAVLILETYEYKKLLDRKIELQKKSSPQLSFYERIKSVFLFLN